jgi:hypothetical protein
VSVPVCRGWVESIFPRVRGLMAGGAGGSWRQHGLGETSWGLLGPREAVSERRSRTLGLAAAVRKFNDLAVPGLGGVWFAKPLLLAALGVSIASRTGRRNIEAANAVEALACWLAFTNNGWHRDARLRGSTKLRGTADMSYSKVRRANFYVTQPMRQQTVQPLLALRFVEAQGERFNAFTMADAGRSLLSAGLDAFRPYKQSVEDFLVRWVTGDDERKLDGPQLTDALAPVKELPRDCRELIKGRLCEGADQGGARRRAGLKWAGELAAIKGTSVSWENRPSAIDESHWLDLRCGGRFFVLRDAAVGALNEAESAISSLSDRGLPLSSRLPVPVERALATVKQRAAAFSEMGYDPSPAALAGAFAQQCDALSMVDLLRELVRRDGRGLVLRGDAIVAGPAYRDGHGNRSADARAQQDAEDAVDALATDDIRWPEGISPRMRNLFSLNQDLEGNLQNWLAPAGETA